MYVCTCNVFLKILKYIYIIRKGLGRGMEYAKHKKTMDSFITLFQQGIYDTLPGREDTFMLSFLLPSKRKQNTTMYHHKNIFDDTYKDRNNLYKCKVNCDASKALRFPRQFDEYVTMYAILQFSEEYNVQADTTITFLKYSSILLVLFFVISTFFTRSKRTVLF